MSRPKKKIILFLVEGNTDINVLAGPIMSLYENYNSFENPYIIEFCTYCEDKDDGGDITSSIGVNPDNIEGIISKNFIEPFMVRNPYYYVKDICEIVQVVDIDGAYVPDSIIEKQTDPTIDKPCYSLKSILVNDPNSFIERNERKRSNIQKLVSMSEIKISKNGGKNTKTVKYSVYYFSRNMDQCLHGIMNANSREKVELSSIFMRKIDNIDLFEKYLIDQGICCEKKDYKQSWEYIMEDGYNSLSRCTNLNVLIDKVRNGL